MTGRWKVSERENGATVAWEARFGPLTLLLRWHPVGAGSWVLLMLPAPPFEGYVSGNDSRPEDPAFRPDLKRKELRKAQIAAEQFAADWLMPFAEAYARINDYVW